MNPFSRPAAALAAPLLVAAWCAGAQVTLPPPKPGAVPALPALPASEYLRFKSLLTRANKPPEPEAPGTFSLLAEVEWVKPPPEGSVAVFSFETARKDPPFVTEIAYIPGYALMKVNSQPMACARDGYAYKVAVKVLAGADRKPVDAVGHEVKFALPKALWIPMRLKECE